MIEMHRVGATFTVAHRPNGAGPCQSHCDCRDDRKGRPYAQRKTAPSEDRAVISTYVSTNEPKDSLRTTDLAVQPLDKLGLDEQFSWL